MFREALPEDRAAYLSLWSECLEELAGLGNQVGSSPAALKDARNLFDAYLSGDLLGSVVLYDPPGEGPQGMAIGGAAWEEPAFASTTLGRLAHGWGDYLRPAHRGKGIGRLLRLNIGRKLKALGFDTLIGEVLLENKAGLKTCERVGLVPYAMVHVCFFKDWDPGSFEK